MTTETKMATSSACMTCGDKIHAEPACPSHASPGPGQPKIAM